MLLVQLAEGEKVKIVLVFTRNNSYNLKKKKVTLEFYLLERDILIL